MMRLGGDPMEAVPLTQASNTGEGRDPGETGSAHLGAGSVCETQTVVQFVERKLYCHWQQDSSFVQMKFTTQAMKRESLRVPLLFGAWLGTGVLISST